MAQTGDPTAPSSGGDWTVQAADTIESIVGSIRDKTTVPITTVARGLVYGLVAGTLGLAALVLLAIGFVRLLAIYLPNAIPWLNNTGGRPVWAADALVGLPFVLLGLVAWAKRRPKSKG